ncbi:MAG: 5'-nucleotidase [Betaproteobacteria bacterium]|nr:5'-nucleotidase [Betaproteobacteria bacterium]
MSFSPPTPRTCARRWSPAFPPHASKFEPDFFFDDQTRHCDSAAAAGPTGHVPHGIANP